MAAKKPQQGNKGQRGADKAASKKKVVQQAPDFDDEDDLEFEDDSELDEGLSDEDDSEMDEGDEELDDEDLDEEEEEEEEEEATQKAKKGAPQKTPTKRKAEEGASSPTKRVRLEDYIPESQVLDYSDRDSRTICIKELHESVQLEDVKKLCKGAVDVRGKKKAPLKIVFVTYTTAEAAQAASKKLQNAKLKENPFKVEMCDATPGKQKPQLSNTVLSVSHIPKGTARPTFKALFPGSRLLRWRYTSALVEFKTPGALEKVIKNPKCHKIGGSKLVFAYAINSQVQKKGKPGVTPAKQQNVTTPKGKGKKSPQAKTPGSAKKTPKQSPKGTPRWGKNTGKKQRA